jgi:hypothetical protein
VQLGKWKNGLLLLLGLVAFTQISAAFRFENDPSAVGLNVGLAIKRLRAQNPAVADRPVIIELIFWQYIAIEVGASDLNGVVYDRIDDTTSRTKPSLILSDERLFQSCLKSYHVSYVIVKDHQLREAVESKLQYPPVKVVNDYAFYPVGEKYLAELPADGTIERCPLSYNEGK